MGAIEREDEYEKKKCALIILAGPLVSPILSASYLLRYRMKGTYASGIDWIEYVPVNRTIPLPLMIL
jgi:hypothetical protein